MTELFRNKGDWRTAQHNGPNNEVDVMSEQKNVVECKSKRKQSHCARQSIVFRRRSLRWLFTKTTLEGISEERRLWTEENEWMG
jgi:hypothetical protein